METNERKILKIEDLDIYGRGIAHKDGATFFVENALVGEVVDAKIEKFKDNLFLAFPSAYLSISPDRVSPKCKYFLSCGGCDLQHLEYEKTLNFKKNQLIVTLKKIGNIEVSAEDIAIEKSDKKYFYRNKIAMPIIEKGGKSTLCMYKKSSHDSVEISNCIISNEKFEVVINIVNKFLVQNKIKAYNEITKEGYAKHIVARIINNSLLLTFVLTEKRDIKLNLLYDELLPYFDKVGINININKSSKEILSNNFCEQVGNLEIEFKLMGIVQPITNASFLQVNFSVQEKLYREVLDNINGVVVNAYSGAGLLTGLIAQNIEKKVNDIKEKALVNKSKLLSNIFNNNKVYGIEINPNAHNLANALFKKNKITNAENICGDANKVLKTLKLENYTLVVDPPRMGLGKELIETILTTLPEKIIYISCETKTLSRDLKMLLGSYEIKKIKGFDMFPQTKNLETMTILKKKTNF